MTETMKRVYIIPPIVAGLLAVACGGDLTGTSTSAKVRVFNAVWPTLDKVGFTANAEFIAGSALAYLQSSPTCAALSAGNATFGFGLANASGTALNSSILATLENQTIVSGGNYSVLAGGNVIHPSVVL